MRIGQDFTERTAFPSDESKANWLACRLVNPTHGEPVSRLPYTGNESHDLERQMAHVVRTPLGRTKTSANGSAVGMPYQRFNRSPENQAMSQPRRSTGSDRRHGVRRTDSRKEDTVHVLSDLMVLRCVFRRSRLINEPVWRRVVCLVESMPSKGPEPE